MSDPFQGVIIDGEEYAKLLSAEPYPCHSIVMKAFWEQQDKMRQEIEKQYFAESPIFEVFKLRSEQQKARPE